MDPHGGGEAPRIQCPGFDPRGLYAGAPKKIHESEQKEDGSSSSKKGKKKESLPSAYTSSSSARTLPKVMTSYDTTSKTQAAKSKPPKVLTQYNVSSSRPSASYQAPITRYDTSSSSKAQKVPMTMYDSKSQAPKSKAPPLITQYNATSLSKAPKPLTQYSSSSVSKAPKPLTQYSTSSSSKAPKAITTYDTSLLSKSQAPPVAPYSSASLSRAPKAMTTYDSMLQAPKTKVPTTQAPKTQEAQTRRPSSSRQPPSVRPPPSIPRTFAPPHVQSIFTSQADIEMASRQTQYEQLPQNERKLQEDWAQDLIKRAGVCPHGFGWRRNGKGYQCWGGHHYIRDEYLSEGKAALDYLIDAEQSIGTEQHGPYYPSQENGLLYEYMGPRPIPDGAFQWLPIQFDNMTEFWWKGKKYPVGGKEFREAEIDSNEKHEKDSLRIVQAMLIEELGFDEGQRVFELSLQDHSAADEVVRFVAQKKLQKLLARSGLGGMSGMNNPPFGVGMLGFQTGNSISGARIGGLSGFGGFGPGFGGSTYNMQSGSSSSGKRRLGEK